MLWTSSAAASAFPCASVMPRNASTGSAPIWPSVVPVWSPCSQSVGAIANRDDAVPSAVAPAAARAFANSQLAPRSNTVELPISCSAASTAFVTPCSAETGLPTSS